MYKRSQTRVACVDLLGDFCTLTLTLRSDCCEFALMASFLSVCLSANRLFLLTKSEWNSIG